MENINVLKKWVIVSALALVFVFLAYQFLSAFILFVPRSRAISEYRDNSAVLQEAAITIIDDPDFTELDITQPSKNRNSEWYVDIDSVSPSVRQVARKHRFRNIVRDRGVILFYRERAFMVGQGILYWDESLPLEQVVAEQFIYTLVHIEGRWYYFRAG